jgi:hypothetical protein
MPETNQQPVRGSMLAVPLSRQYFLYAGKTYTVAAVIFILIGAIGWRLFSWLFSIFDEPSLTVIWLTVWFSTAVPVGIAGYERLRWARHGPDLWLRISQDGVELVQVRLLIRPHRLTWPQINKWWMAVLTIKRQYIRIRSDSGRILDINPMDYIWSRGKWEETLNRAIALERDIEALFKLYAKDRQGETEKIPID